MHPLHASHGSCFVEAKALDYDHMISALSGVALDTILESMHHDMVLLYRMRRSVSSFSSC